MTPDQKACQEAFEEWCNESGRYNLEKTRPIERCENHYANGITYYTYHGWKAAWRNRTEALRKLKIGDFDLCLGSEWPGKVWIHRKGGDGGIFDIKEFEAAIEAFFVEKV